MKILTESEKKIKIFCNKALKVGFFLALRQIKRSSLWTTVFIIFIMFLTFLNLVVVNGILVGLIEGSAISYRSNYSGDLLISAPEDKDFIKDSQEIIKIVKSLEGVEGVSPRILTGGKILYNYKRKFIEPDLPDQISAQIAGINPELENTVTGFSDLIIAGENLEKGDKNFILIGSNLLKKYFQGFPGAEYLEEEVDVGTKVKILIGESEKEMTIKGIVKSKIGAVGGRVYILDSWLEELMDRKRKEVNEIAVKLKKGYSPDLLKENILAAGVSQKYALVQTWEESQGQFFEDIKNTFSMLSNVIGSIGIIVASITLFIVIFINAISREKFIGILKGIGICKEAIEISYILQSLFYTLSGILLGMAFIYLLLKPYISNNPIDFPFSDGILVAPINGVLLRAMFLLVIATIASYIPAKIIIKKNTLDSILGRK